MDARPSLKQIPMSLSAVQKALFPKATRARYSGARRCSGGLVALVNERV